MIPSVLTMYILIKQSKDMAVIGSEDLMIKYIVK